MEHQAKTTVITDAATTIVALNGGAVELNPIITPTPTGIVAISLVKWALVEHVAQSDLEDRDDYLRIMTGVWGGASINNLLVILGASNPISILAGIIGGYLLFKQPASDEPVDKETDLVYN